MRYLTVSVLVLLAPVLSGPSAAAGEKKVLLLNGFEPKVIKEWFEKHPVKKIGYAGYVFCSPKGKFFGGRWPSVEGDATEGKWALVRELPGEVVRSDRWKFAYLKNEKASETGLRRAGKLVCHGGSFRHYYPTDWTGYAKFRADVKCQGSTLRLRVILEDAISISQHTLLRRFEVPADKWVTVEVDLAEAARLREVKLPPEEAKRLGVKKLKGRLLNLKEMANIWIGIELIKGKCTVKLDNIRLVAPGAQKAESKLPVVSDKRPFPVPEFLPKSAPAPRAKIAGKLNRAPLKWEQPVEIPGASYTWDVAVVDNDRMLMAVKTDKVLKTVDGGRTWTGLDGTPNKPTKIIKHDLNAPGRGAEALGPDLLLLGVAHCAGGGAPVDHYSHLVKFEGGKWNSGPRSLVDVDVRHCPEWKVDAVRLPNGRIWACWRHYDRFAREYVAARYSDDEGRTWRSAASNGLARIANRGKTDSYGMTWWLEQPAMPAWVPAQALGLVAPMYYQLPMPRPEIAAWGDQAMIAIPAAGKRTVCSFFDGEKWGKPVPTGFKGGCASLTHLEGKVVYMATIEGEVYRLEGAKWIKDTPPGGVGTGRLPYPALRGCSKTRLSAAGKVMVCTWVSAGGRELFVSQKPKGGDWSKPRKIFNEERGVQWIGAPVRSAENFVPLVWTIRGKRSGARFLRIPVEQPPK